MPKWGYNPHVEGINQLAQQIIQSAPTHDWGKESREANQLKLQSELRSKEEEEGLKRNLAIAKLLKGENPDISVGVSDRSVTMGQKPMSTEFKTIDDERLETGAVQNTYEKLIGESRSKHQELKQAEALLNSPNAVSYGQLQNTLARLKEKGAMTEGDIARTMPKSLKADFINLKNYLTGGTENPLPEETKASIAAYLTSLREMEEKKLGASKAELSKRAPYLAPTLQRSGKLPKVLESLGETMAPVQQEQPPVDPEVAKKQRLQQLRAKKAGM